MWKMGVTSPAHGSHPDNYQKKLSHFEAAEYTQHGRGLQDDSFVFIQTSDKRSCLLCAADVPGVVYTHTVKTHTVRSSAENHSLKDH